MTDKRSNKQKTFDFLQTKKKKKSLTENQTQVTTAALKKKKQTYSSLLMSNKLFSGIVFVFYLISLIAFAKLYLNLETALFFVHKLFLSSNCSDLKLVHFSPSPLREGSMIPEGFATTKPLKTTSHGHESSTELHYSNTGRLLA